LHFKHDATHHASQCFATPNQLYTVSGCFVILIKRASDTQAWLNTADLFSCFPTGSPNYSWELREAECRFAGVGLGGLVL